MRKLSTVCICILLAALLVTTAFAGNTPSQPAQGKELLSATRAQAAKTAPVIDLRAKNPESGLNLRVSRGKVDASAVKQPASNAVQSVELASPLKAEYLDVLAQIAELQAQGGDFSALKTRASELYQQIYGGRESTRPLDQGGETCATATPITGVPFCDTGTTIGAANDYAGSCVGGSAPDVVYTFTLEQPATVTVSLCGSFYDTGLHLWLGCPDAGGTQVACNDDFCDLQSCITITLSLGTYYIIVDGFAANSGDYALYVNADGACTPCPAQPPANDDCVNAMHVDVPSQTAGSTTSATADPNAPFCGTSVDASGVWYHVIGDGSTLTASLCNEVRNYDTKIHVYTCDCDHLSCVTGVDDFCGLGSQVSWCSVAGEGYLIFVEGFGGEVGDFRLDVSSDGIPCEEGAECPCWEATLEAPGVYNGVLDELEDADCYEIYESVLVQVTIPFAGMWAFSLCGSDFDTWMQIGTDCCLDDICLNDDSQECENSLHSYCCVELLAGVYYVDVESWSGDEFGDFVLTVEPCGAPEQGESCADPIVIGSLPYTAAGNTTGRADDHDPDCAYGISGAPDVAYSFTPTTDMEVTVNLCGAWYDSKVFILDELGNVVCCNDDGCDNPEYEGDEGFQSIIECCLLLGGHTYCIVVDGYCSTCYGEYTIAVRECEPETCAPCPDGASLEGEVDCSDGYVDATNGGCNSDPEVFGAIQCGETVCGTGGNYLFDGLDYRDTDWFAFSLTQPESVVVCVLAEFAPQIAIVGPGPNGCDDLVVYANVFETAPCQVACAAICLPAGEYAVFVATNGFAGVPCGSNYTVHMECLPCGDQCNPTPVVEFPSHPVPQSECANLCAGTTTQIIICGDGLNQAQPPIVTVTPGCHPDNTDCERDCDPAQFLFSNTGWTFIEGCWYNIIIGQSDGCVCITLEGFLGVELNGFSAIAHDGSIDLTWSTASETNNSRFDLLRNGVTVAQITATNSATGSTYEWTDRDVVNGTTYAYTLVSVDVSGNREEVATTEATPAFGSAVVTEYALHQNYPNPFNPETNITFDLVAAGNVTLSVYNLMGQEVAMLVNGMQEAGRHSVSFDASHLPSGVYLYKLEANGFSAQMKMMLMK